MIFNLDVINTTSYLIQYQVILIHFDVEIAPGIHI